MWPYMGGLNNRMKNYRLLYVILPVLGGSLRAVPRCKITIKMRNYGALVAMCVALAVLTRIDHQSQSLVKTGHV